MKTILMKKGIIAYNGVTAPLRPLTAAEIEKLDVIATELELGRGY
jgi:dihydrodipicolinate synthase/N-acetylneuraminate lyase